MEQIEPRILRRVPGRYGMDDAAAVPADPEDHQGDPQRTIRGDRSPNPVAGCGGKGAPSLPGPVDAGAVFTQGRVEGILRGTARRKILSSRRD